MPRRIRIVRLRQRHPDAAVGTGHVRRIKIARQVGHESRVGRGIGEAANPRGGKGRAQRRRAAPVVVFGGGRAIVHVVQREARVVEQASGEIGGAREQARPDSTHQQRLRAGAGESKAHDQRLLASAGGRTRGERH
ncbi:MAG: hypothetical protein BWX86_02170 [Verrucomicrobia bacterium ADurb.Bin122]|nr:MAG: hypothetical protein BWX86_02170 [Verrucomicrobia bacterium ADurb.Bin122]